MAYSNFWKKRAIEFCAIQDRGALRLEWTAKQKRGALLEVIFSLKGVSKSQRSPQYEFEALARRCGRRIDPSKDSFNAWCDYLWKLDVNRGTIEVSREFNPDGTVTHVNRGVTLSVCRASADVCRMLECIALETKQKPVLADSSGSNQTRPDRGTDQPSSAILPFGTEPDPDAWFDYTRLAEIFSLQKGAFRKRLERFRQGTIEGWKSNDDRHSRQPHYLYQYGAIRSIVEELRASTARPAK